MAKSHSKYQITPIDEYIANGVKHNPFIYDPDARFFHSTEKRQVFFKTLSEDIQLLYKENITGAESSEKWRRLRKRFTKTDLKKKQGKRLTNVDNEILELLQFLSIYTTHKEQFSDDEYVSLDEMKYPTINVNDPNFNETSPEIDAIIKSIENSKQKQNSLIRPNEKSETIVISDENDSIDFQRNKRTVKNEEKIEEKFTIDCADENTGSEVKSSVVRKEIVCEPIKVKQQKKDNEGNRSISVNTEMPYLESSKTVGSRKLNVKGAKKTCTTAKGNEIKDALRSLNDSLKKQELDNNISARVNIICNKLNMISKDKQGIGFIKVMQILKKYTSE